MIAMVKLIVDKERRLQLMRMHTTTHILLRSFKNILGFHVWQTGSNLDENISRLDIQHHKEISKNDIEEVENLANSIVFENRKVNTYFLKRSEAENKYGFEIYQGGIVPGNYIRIVEIENFDAQACSGLHVNSTIEIGLIKIVGITKIQDGIYRILYTCGPKLLEIIRNKEEILQSICNIFSTDEKSIVKVSERFFNEWKERGKEIDYLLSLIAQILPNNRILEVQYLKERELIKILTTSNTENILIISEENLIGVKHPKVETLKDVKGFKRNNIFVGRIKEEKLEEIKKWFSEKSI